MKHTPGPWDATIYSGAFDQPIINGPDGVICRVHSQNERQHEANAKLIAAAPDLLEALKEYLQAGHKEARREASVKAKAAIAKAEGKV